MYENESKGHVVPAAYCTAGNQYYENRATLLVSRGHLTAATQTSVTAGPVTGTVFFCPSASDDQFALRLSAAPLVDEPKRDPARTPRDARSARGWRTLSRESGQAVDVWYAINGATGGSRSFPTWTLDEGSALRQFPKFTMIRRASKTASMFDGIFMNLAVSAGRIDPRHGHDKVVNVLFADGHTASLQRDTLPPGAPPNLFRDENMAELSRRYPYPRWRLDQP